MMFLAECRRLVLWVGVLIARAGSLNVQVWPLHRINESKLEQHRCTSEVFCQGPLLHAVQTADIFRDSKRFVDMTAKYNKYIIAQKFKRLGKKPTREQLTDFVAENFQRAGWDLRVVVPKDWRENPRFLSKIADKRLAQFGRMIHEKWKALVRMIDAKRTCEDCETTSIPLPHPFVVPGGRFRELYYWDSYWILEGLYVSGMCETARAIINNFKWLIETYGFIPNGSRKYYLNRSNPPLFTLMCNRFVEACVSEGRRHDWIKAMLPYMDQEYLFWSTFRTVTLPRRSSGGGMSIPEDYVVLSMYRANTVLPRPESYHQDTLLSSQLASHDAATAEALYRNLATGAESGWDFSVRWFRDPHANLTSIATADIIPVDLNVILHQNERLLERFHEACGSTVKSEFYSEKARRRRNGIEEYLEGWSDFDYARNVSMAAHQVRLSSNLAGLWFGGLDSMNTTHIESLLEKHRKLLSAYPGGIPNNEIASGEQWDFPNVWAPIQYHFITVYERLAKTDPKWGPRALELAQRLVNTTFCGHQNYGQIFEKYHAQLVGQPGGGGEYIVQEGFGWTNGVLLWVLNKYGDRLVAPERCPLLGSPIILSTDTPDVRSEVAFRRWSKMDYQTRWVLTHPVLCALIVAAVLSCIGYLLFLLHRTRRTQAHDRRGYDLLRSTNPLHRGATTPTPHHHHHQRHHHSHSHPHPHDHEALLPFFADESRWFHF